MPKLAPPSYHWVLNTGTYFPNKPEHAAQLKVRWYLRVSTAQTPAAINRPRVNLRALWVTGCFDRSSEITENKNTFAKTMSVSVLGGDLKLMPHGWSRAKWDNTVISPDLKLLFQIDLFCTKSIFSLGCPLALASNSSGRSPLEWRSQG